MVNASGFREAMSLLGGAVSVITTDGEAGRCGFTASAVCSVTDQPPTLLVCMNRASFANAFFQRNGLLAVNVLAAEHSELSGVFANKHLTMDERFERASWSIMESGSPLLDEALVNFDCRIVQTHEVGTHNIFYCEVLSVRTRTHQPEGLVYFNRKYHRVGDDSGAIC